MAQREEPLMLRGGRGSLQEQGSGRMENWGGQGVMVPGRDPGPQ